MRLRDAALHGAGNACPLADGLTDGQQVTIVTFDHGWLSVRDDARKQWKVYMTNVDPYEGKVSTVRFKAMLSKMGSWALVTLPRSASAKLPSRGLAIVEGTINGFCFRAALEPDGKGSHWFRVNKSMREAAGADAGDTVTLAIEPAREWPEPRVPADLKKALAAAPQARTAWMDITPMARWDWIRWIDAAKQRETRRRRIENACAMLKAGKRRPCCFNRSLPTLPRSASAKLPSQGREFALP